MHFLKSIDDLGSRRKLRQSVLRVYGYHLDEVIAHAVTHGTLDQRLDHQRNKER